MSIVFLVYLNQSIHVPFEELTESPIRDLLADQEEDVWHEWCIEAIGVQASLHI